jgi:hypothetical protein
MIMVIDWTYKNIVPLLMVFIFSLERMNEKLKNRLVINVNEVDRHILRIDFFL